MPERLFRLTRRASDSNSRDLVVLLHGLGSHEGDLMGLAPMLGSDFHLVTLRAPYVYEPGFSWFDIGWSGTSLTIDEAQAFSSLDILISELRDLQQEFGVEQCVLGGFSQGAIMSLGVVLTAPELIRGAILLSGAVLPAYASLPVIEASQHVPCLVQHGTFDPVLPLQQGHSVRALLSSRSVPLVFEEYPMGHAVSMESIESLRTWLAQLLGSK